jgi:hypothetical protein
MDPESSTSNNTEREDNGDHVWPRLAAVAKLPQPDWGESLMKQLGLQQKESSPFKYAPIETNQIRLLFLIPSRSPDAVLEANMFVSNFPNITLDGWQALSYTWGNANELPGIIIINGCKMKITENLELALRDLRNGDAVPYWVDAICINQADPVEKGHQIQHMRYIYEKATRVGVWLGREDQQIEQAMVSLAAYNILDDESIIVHLAKNEWSNDILDGLLSLFSRPYWKRIWVLQELVCGGEVYVNFGRRSVSLEVLIRTRRLLNLSLELIEASSRPLSSVPKLRAVLSTSKFLGTISITRELRSRTGRSGIAVQEDDRATGLLALLQLTKNHQATDPRDKIFALLGLIEDIYWCTDLFPIDYTLTVEQLYIDVARWIIVNSESLSILCTPRPIQASSSLYKLPSWCPDWTVGPQTNSLFEVSELKMSIPRELFKPATATFGPEEHSMTATGVLIDAYKTAMGPFRWKFMYWYQFLTLSQDGQISFDGAYSIDQVQLLHQWSKDLNLSKPALCAVDQVEEQKARLKTLQEHVPQLRDDPAVDKRLENLWRTLVLDMIREQSEKMLGFCSMFNHLLGWNDRGEGGLVPSWKYSNHDIQPFRTRVEHCVHGRQLAITQKGHIGMIPVTAQVGDVVCNLFGCPVPLVLRRQGTHYIVVGEAYIRDYMSLEAIREMKDGKLKQMAFVLH